MRQSFGTATLTLHRKANRSFLEIAVERTLLVVAVGMGLLIAWIDSRPNWDDAGVTAFALLASCSLFGALMPKRPWLWALGVGLWIPILGIAMNRNFGSLLALAFAFAGAYAGSLLGKLHGMSTKEMAKARADQQCSDRKQRPR